MQTLFTTDQGIILIRLVLLHFLNDFLIQPNSWVKHRYENHYKSSRLYLHSFMAGFAAYIAFWDWRAFPVFIVVTISHLLIDLWKAYQVKVSNNLGYFLIDQLAHISVLVICWLVWVSGFGKLGHIIVLWFSDYGFMLVLLGYITCIFPIGYIVSFSTERWRRQIESTGNESLSEAGKWIGIIERILVFTLVLTGKFETIGLLLAAKSILRFSDIEARKNTEYVLIGTLISFTLAILMGLLIKGVL